MPLIPFDEWLPDQADLVQRGIPVAKNVLPGLRGYVPMKSLETITSALDSRALGALQVMDKDLNVLQYAGDAGKIYENQDNTWTDVSQAGGYSTGADEKWEFAQWQNKILGTNFTDSPQQLVINGSNFSDLTTDFRARRIAVLRNQVMFGDTYDSSDGEKPNRLRWSALNDETDYTVSSATLSDFNDLKSGGEIVKITPVFDQGVVFQNDLIWTAQFVGSPAVWSFDRAFNVGALSPGSVINFGDGNVFFLSERGLYALINGTRLEPIGAEKVNRYIQKDLDLTYVDRITSAFDGTHVFWSYPGQGNSEGTPNKILVYSLPLNRFSIIEKEVDMIFASASIAITLEGLNSYGTMETLGISLDSPVWKGGTAKILAAFDTDHKSGFFQGADMEAILETSEIELNPGRQTMLKAFRPVVVGANPTARVGYRQDLADTKMYTPILQERSTGRFTPRKDARFHCMELTIAGGFDHALGVRVEPKDARPGGYRGR